MSPATSSSELVDAAELPWADDERVRFSVTNIAEALAPSNNPLLSPVAWKAAIDTGGRNALSGTRRLVRDLSTDESPAYVNGVLGNIVRDRDSLAG